jgi:uncharacterized protein YjlB
MASTYTAAKAVESRLYPTAFAKRALFLLLLCLSCKLTQPVAREMVINNAFSLQTKLADRLLYIHNWSLLLCFTTKSFCHYYSRAHEIMQLHTLYQEPMNWMTFPKQMFDRFQTNFGQIGKSQSAMVINNTFSLQTKLADRPLYIHNWSLLLCFTMKSLCHYYCKAHEVMQLPYFYFEI